MKISTATHIYTLFLRHISPQDSCSMCMYITTRSVDIMPLQLLDGTPTDEPSNMQSVANRHCGTISATHFNTHWDNR